MKIAVSRICRAGSELISAAAHAQRYIPDMTLKKKVLIAIAFLTGVLFVVLLYLGKNPLPLIFLGALSFFLVYALWNPISKHKTFGYLDQQRAMRAFDRSDILSLTIGSGSKKKKKRRKKLF